MGYKEGELLVFTAQDSGLSLKVKRVPGGLIDDVRRKFLAQLPEPKPPINRVNYGTETDPHWEEESNPADPAYVTALDAWKRVFNERLGDASQTLMMKLGVVPYLEMTPEKKAMVDALREMMRENFSVELEEDDRLVYINRIVLVTPEDMQDLAMFLMRRQQPTEAAIAESIRKF